MASIVAVEVMTPAKEQFRGPSRSKISKESPAALQNKNPNLTGRSPGTSQKQKGPTIVGSSNSRKSSPRDPSMSGNCNFSARSRIRERKFIVAKKNSRKDGDGKKFACSKCREKFGGNVRKCFCMDYENLRASQEEFFKVNVDGTDDLGRLESGKVEDAEGVDIQKCLMMHDIENDVGLGDEIGEGFSGSPIGVSTIKRRRDKLMEAATKSIPEDGRVMHLVKAFENLRTLCNPGETEKADNKVVNWALPGLQPPKVSLESESCLSLFSPSDLRLTAENLGLDSRASLALSWVSCGESTRTSIGGRRSRRASLDSPVAGGGRRLKNKEHQRNTSQKPFKLKTEQRGKLKEEEFVKKIHEMMLEEERQRIPIAQGLPWTIDEPECLVKPPVKENTRPLDFKMHTDMRASERFEFDQKIATKLNLLEQHKEENERQQKLEAEEEIKRLRKELVPKAQPMPYFDRPFVPRRSTKNPTIPIEPRFHIPQHKKIKSCLSWNDMTRYTFQL